MEETENIEGLTFEGTHNIVHLKMKEKENYGGLTIDEEIEIAEERYETCIQEYVSLCNTVKLYHEKMDTYGRSLVACFTPYERIELSMLNFLTDEMGIVRQEFEKLAADVKMELLPYVHKQYASDIMKTNIEDAVFLPLFNPHDLTLPNSPSQKEARQKAKEESRALERAVLPTFFTSNHVFSDENSEIVRQLLERYKRENKEGIDFDMEHLKGDMDEKKEKLDDELKETPAGECYFEAKGLIGETIYMMYNQGCVMRDLLPLLKYLAMYDRLTVRERGVEEPKKQSTEEKKKGRGRPKSILFSDKEVKQRECERVKGYLREGSSQVAKWRRDKTNPIQKVAICFVRHWKEHGYIDEDYSPRALAKFFVEDCGVQMAEPGKDIGKTYDNLGQGVKEKEADFDEEIYALVGGKFKK